MTSETSGKFKVGDKVTVIKVDKELCVGESYQGIKKYIGKRGTIINVAWGGEDNIPFHSYDVDFSGGNVICFFETEIKKKVVLDPQGNLW